MYDLITLTALIKAIHLTVTLTGNVRLHNIKRNKYNRPLAASWNADSSGGQYKKHPISQESEKIWFCPPHEADLTSHARGLL